MSEQKNNSQEKKDSGKTDDKNKKDKPWAEQVAENIAGDNEMLKSVIKFLANPIVLLGALIALMWWLFSGKEKKEKFATLEKENKELKEELTGLAEDFRSLKDKHRNLRSRFFMKEEDEQEDSLNGRKEKKENYYESRYSKKNNYRSSYLD